MPPKHQRRPAFRFAVIADTHLSPEDGVSPSPWDSNGLANARARFAIRRLNEHGPAFVVHLGDMVHPVPAQPEYEAAAARFHEIFAELDAPLRLAPGNHDMGDKPTPWVPAKIVCNDFISLYEKHFGSHFYSFDHDTIHVIILNSQILNSGLEAEQAQWDWLERDLVENAGKRIFVFGHYPLYLSDPKELEHYDNTAEPARSRLLELLRRYKAEAFFSAHVHNFFYNLDGPTEHYVMPSLTALRHDYSEMFSIPPAEGQEFGRNDSCKLGFFIIDVFDDGHTVHYVRTGGATIEDRESEHTPSTSPPLLHSRQLVAAPVGIELRHAWADTVSIPYSGVVDAFTRKPVHNDYMLAGIWEMGLASIRVPVEDILDPARRRRMMALQKSGLRFSVFFFGLPQDNLRDVLVSNRALFSQLEVILPSADIRASLGALKALGAAVDCPVYLSRLRSSSDHGEAVEGRFAHAIDHGFHAGDDAFINGLDLAGNGIGGLVFQTGANERASDIADRILKLVVPSRLQTKLTVRMSGENAARHHGSPGTTAALVCDALLTAYAARHSLEIVFDTLFDNDRGYYPCLGLIDRRMNPTGVSRCFATLHAELAGREFTGGATQTLEEGGYRRLTARAGDETLHLFSPAGGKPTGTYCLPGAGAGDAVTAMHLQSGMALQVGPAPAYEISVPPHLDSTYPILAIVR